MRFFQVVFCKVLENKSFGILSFLGYKGMVVIDHRLVGIKMRLRPSMRKFVVDNDEDAWLEIARAFERPNSFSLNRYVVTHLQGFQSS